MCTHIIHLFPSFPAGLQVSSRYSVWSNTPSAVVADMHCSDPWESQLQGAWGSLVVTASMNDYSGLNIQGWFPLGLTGFTIIIAIILQGIGNEKWKKVKVAQSCPTLCNPMDCSLPGSYIHGIFQALFSYRVALYIVNILCAHGIRWWPHLPILPSWPYCITGSNFKCLQVIEHLQYIFLGKILKKKRNFYSGF